MTAVLDIKLDMFGTFCFSHCVIHLFSPLCLQNHIAYFLFSKVLSSCEAASPQCGLKLQIL